MYFYRFSTLHHSKLIVTVIRKIHPSAKLALVYLGFSVLWILLSDELVSQLANHDIDVIRQLQSVKGIVFVVSSGLLLYFTWRKIYKYLQESLVRKDEALNKLNALNEATGEGIIDYNVETDTAVVNDEVRSLLGVDSSVIPNFSQLHNKHIHSDDRSRAAEHTEAFLKSNNSVWQWEYRYAAADGSYRDLISRGYVIRDKETQKALNIIYTLQDVTDIRSAMTRYYQQEIQFRQSLSKRVIEAQEKERNRWAQELHDNVCQVLTVAKLCNDQALLDNEENTFIQKSKQMVEKALHDIRHMSAHLKSPEFEVTSLQEAVTSLVETIKRFGAFHFEMKYDLKTDDILSAEQKLMVYRVVQEQLNNIMKYSGAAHVWLHIDVKDQEVAICIKDDGKGFDPSKAKAGIGLKNINSRLQVFSGNLQINSSPGKGCELKAQFNII